MPPLSRKVKPLLQTLPTNSPDPLQNSFVEDFERDPESSDEDKCNIPEFKPKRDIEIDHVTKKPRLAQPRAPPRWGSRPLTNPLLSKSSTTTRTTRQNQQDKADVATTGSKRKRGNLMDDWNEADELGDDEFNVIRDSSASAQAKKAEDDFMDNVHFGGSSQPRGSQPKSYSRSSQQRNIHGESKAKTKSPRPSQEQKSGSLLLRDICLAFTDIVQPFECLLDLPTLRVCIRPQNCVTN